MLRNCSSEAPSTGGIAASRPSRQKAILNAQDGCGSDAAAPATSGVGRDLIALMHIGRAQEVQAAMMIEDD